MTAQRSPISSPVVLFSLGTLFHSAAVVLLQILALISQVPADFGRFSALYLFFALSSSVALSVVCEAWQRVRPSASWKEYSAPLLYLSVSAGLLTGGVFSLFPGFEDLFILGGVAVGFATYRTGARYFSMHERDFKWILPADIGGTVVLAAGWLIFLLAPNNFSPVALFSVWAASSLVGAMTSRPAAGYHPNRVPIWVKKHRQEIRTLLSDSLTLDASNIGTPYALIPILGVTGFGVYRALSNISGPVKLLLAPIRPLFSTVSPARFATFKSVGIFVGLALIIGAVCFAALQLLSLSQLSIGTLTALTDYIWQSSVFVAGTFLNGIYYLVARTHFSRARLLAARAITSIVGILFPRVGALLWGLDGAITMVTVATVVFAVTWIVLLFQQKETHVA